MSEIRITYVTITYNAAKVLKRTLDSVLEQDYPNIEHLIIDGASTDDTLKLVNDYIAQSNAAENGHQIQVTSEPDKGIYDAMNKGLRCLTGDYVCFLNAGDYLPAPDIASRIAQAITDTNHPSPNTSQLPAVAYGDTDIVDGEGHFLHHRRLAPRTPYVEIVPPGHAGMPSGFYARADYAIATPYDMQYRYSADVDWCIRVMKAAAKEEVPLLNLHMVVANYTQEGQTTLHHRESLWERYRVMEHHYGRVQTFLLHCWFAVRAFLKY